jgi:MFS family permease
VDDSGPVPIILIPQPSDDPNDPLNWPLWKRDLITFILSLTAIFSTALGPILAANTVTLSLWFVVDFTRIALLTGYFLLGAGVASILFVPSSRIWGKRHTFIIGTIITIGSSAWAGAVDRNYSSFLWSRIIQGVGCAPFEALVNAAVGDLYFVHQRGKRMAFTNLAVFGGSFFTPILVGKITHTLKWWWTFYLVAIFTAACLPAIIFLCPETAYRRDAKLNTDMIAEDATGLPTTQENKEAETNGEGSNGETSNGTTINGNGTDDAHISPLPGANTPKTTWVQSLMPFNGRKTDDRFLTLLLRPFPLFLQPAFFWGCLIQGTMIGWTVFIGVILAQFFLGYPLWWTEVDTGYAYTGAFIGAIMGFIISGLLADWSAKVMTKWNNGVYEPEFRIILVIPQLIFGVMGLYGWGITADGVMKNKYGENGWVIPLMFFAFEVCGMVIGAVASSLYIVDAYRDLAIEGFTCMIIFKNFFSYGLTYKAYDWILENKTKAQPVFNALGTVQLIVCLLSIPMYIYGKRNRSFWHRHDILKKLGLK